MLNYLHTKCFLFLTLKLKIIFRDTDEIVKCLSCLYLGKTEFLVTAILYTFLDEKSILHVIVILQWQKMCHFFYLGLLFYKRFGLWCSLHPLLEARLWTYSQPRLLSCVWLFATPWTVAHQALLSVEFSRQKYWSGLSFPSPGDLSNSGSEP